MTSYPSHDRMAWRALADAVAALGDADAASAEVRGMAAITRDLMQLIITWPVARKLRLEEELAELLFGLCERSGTALCGGRFCPARCRHRADAQCSAILSRQADDWLRPWPAAGV